MHRRPSSGYIIDCMHTNGTETGTGRGTLIAFMGLPGSGKTSTARELANLLEAAVYLEPNEEHWPQAVLNRHRVGAFTALTWFRSMRVPLLVTAAGDRDAGRIAVLDSYYDKLIAGYIDDPAMQWLIGPDDPYFEVAKQMAILDKKLLPDVDILIFLQVTEANWNRLLSTRNRAMDQEAEFLKSFSSQSEFLAASKSYTETTGARLVVYEQQFGSAHSTAVALREHMQELGLLDQE